MAERLGYLKKRKKKIQWKEKGFIFLLVIVPLVNFALFWVYVNIDTIWMTFQKFNVRNNAYEWIGLERYVNVFKDYVFGGDVAKRHLFYNSFRAWLINLIIFPLALISAYAFFKKVPWEKYFRVCFYLPSIISITVLTLIFRYMFHPDFGPVSMLFNKVGLSGDWLSPESNRMWGLIFFYCIWSGLGVNVIMMNSAMLRIPQEIIESGKLDGIGFWREMAQIVFPLIMPTVSVYILNIFLSVFGFTLHPMMLAMNPGVDNKFMTVGWFIFSSVAGGSEIAMLDASTVGIVLSLIMVPLIVAVRLITKKLTPDVDF